MTPDDVYALVDARTGRTQMLLLTVGITLSGLILLQIFAKVVIWQRVIRLLVETKALSREMKVLVRIAETHANMSDTQTARTESLVAQAKEVAEKVSPIAARSAEAHVIEEVRQVPERTAMLLRRDSGGSGVIPPGD